MQKDDMIYRQAAIDALLYKGQSSRRYKLGETWELDLDEITEAIGSVPTQQAQRWIPVTEQLPEENGVYIVSYEDTVTWLEWFNGKWFFYPSNPVREETGTIIAWMSLPEPYKERREK